MSTTATDIRSDFPILNRPLPNGKPVVYLDSGASAQKPQCVIDKQREVQENYFANAYRGRHFFGSRIDAEMESVRERVRKLISADSTDEIIFTSGSTFSVNLVATAWGRKFLNAGDELLLNEMEHHANLVPWQRIAAEQGATLRFIPLTEDGQLDMNQLDDVLTEKTKLVAVCGMSNVLGTINPVREIAAKAKRVGALTFVDGAQSIPHAAVDVQADGIDFICFSGHKLYGPTGIGVLYGRRDLLMDMDPFVTGGHMIDRVYREYSTYAEPPAKFEAGTPAIVEAIGLGAAIDYVNDIGFDLIHQIEHEVLTYAHAELLAIPGLRIYGPDVDQKGSIVSFTIENLHPEDLAAMLDRCGVFTRHGHHCTMPLHDWLGVSATTRASFAVYNSRADVDALVEAIHFARKKLRLI